MAATQSYDSLTSEQTVTKEGNSKGIFVILILTIIILQTLNVVVIIADVEDISWMKTMKNSLILQYLVDKYSVKIKFY